MITLSKREWNKIKRYKMKKRNTKSFRKKIKSKMQRSVARPDQLVMLSTLLGEVNRKAYKDMGAGLNQRQLRKRKRQSEHYKG